MNPIEYALSEIRNQIPEEILRLAFPGMEGQWDSGIESLDFRIRVNVIEKRVRVDVDLIGGTEEILPLDRMNVNVVDFTSCVVHVPSDITQNRSIVQVYDISYGPTGYPATANLTSTYGSYSSSPRGNRVSQIVSTAAGTNAFVLGDVQILGNNTFSVRYNGLLSPGMFIRCRLADDENLNSIRQQSYHVFSKMCVLACKAYIFRKFAISLDQGQLQGGMQLGVIRELVWNYQESEELYQEARQKWRAVAVMNDTRQYRPFLNSQIGLL